MTGSRPAPNPKTGRLWLTGALLLLAGLFVWLGLWQVERRQWKHDLIAAVDVRAHGAAVAAPPRVEWPTVSAESHAYLHVRASGHFLDLPASFVQAVTDRGAGYWVLSPLDSGDGVILINRGFVTARKAAPPPVGQVEVTGLLRLSEPDGGFLRRNDPAADRWYSRDVAAIAAARGLADVAPYFIDAARATKPAGADVPVGGLTVIRFADNHMSYLLTWFALALMSLGAIWLVWRKSGMGRPGFLATDGRLMALWTIRRITPADADAGRRNMRLLIQLRWLAVIGQLVTIAFVHRQMGIELPLGPLLLAVAGLVVVNLGSLPLLYHRSAVSNEELTAVLLVDVTVLTWQLYHSGGIGNPFVSLYLLQIVLGAILLKPATAWAIVAASFLAITVLALTAPPLALPPRWQADPMGLYLWGSLVGFALIAVLLVLFVARVSRNLSKRDAALAAVRQQAAEEDHIVRMGLLASGAAHELGTPLASMAVLVGDWKRLPPFTADAAMREELGDMEAAIARCKSIVGDILNSAGEARGIAPERMGLRVFLTAIVEDWRASRPDATLLWLDHLGDDVTIVADLALRQVIGNAIDNALVASPGWIAVSAWRDETTLLLEVLDQGPGFTAEMLQSFGRPYQSTKGRPGGGLGLFLLVNVVRKLGGSATAFNRPEGGACVRITLPLATLSAQTGPA